MVRNTVFFIFVCIKALNSYANFDCEMLGNCSPGLIIEDTSVPSAARPAERNSTQDQPPPSQVRRLPPPPPSQVESSGQFIDVTRYSDDTVTTVDLTRSQGRSHMTDEDWKRHNELIEKESSESSEKDFNECTSAHRVAKNSCLGLTIAPVALSLINQFKSTRSDGNIKKACESAAKINGLGTVLNLGFAVTCMKSQSKCVSTCERVYKQNRGIASEIANVADDRVAECQQYAQVAQFGLLQTAISASQFAGSQACADIASDKCAGRQGEDDPDCVQFCLKVGRQEHPRCQMVLADCNNASYRSQNQQLCQCLASPTAPGCGLTGPIDLAGLPPTSGLPETDPFDGLDDIPGINEFNGNPDLGGGSKVQELGGSGGGFAGGGGGSAPFGGSDGKNDGSGDEPLNKDILSGTGGGAGGGAAFGAGGGGFEGGGGGGGSGSRSRGDGDGLSGFDLRAFLPGGKKDPRGSRGLASTGDKTITEANGLSNFQKVTRKINEKKVELLP